MAKLIYGDRIGQMATLAIGCSALIFDPADAGHQSFLLTRRTDNGRWCLPGGQMEAGESAEEACAREVWEETGLTVRIVKLVGVYSTPHRITEYADGNRRQFVGLHFVVAVTTGELGLSNETTEAGYFTRGQMANMDVMENHLQRIDDTFAEQPAAFIR